MLTVDSVADPRCLSRIPDPNFFDPGSASKIKYFNPKNLFASSRKYDLGCSSPIRQIRIFSIPDPYLNLTFLSQKTWKNISEMIRVVYPESGSWFFTHPGSRGQKGTGSQIRNNDGGSWSEPVFIYDLVHWKILIRNWFVWEFIRKLIFPFLQMLFTKSWGVWRIFAKRLILFEKDWFF